MDKKTRHIERRFLHGKVEERADGANDGFNFGGLASRTGVEYVMYEDSSEIWTEIIDPAAFDEVLNNDVRVLVNHGNDKILGRTKSGTAKIWKASDGLRYAWTNPDTSYATDIAVSIMRGDIDQSSFGFRTAYENNKWEEYKAEDERMKTVRTILKIDELFDVSPVTFPANPDTEAGQRDYIDALIEYREKKEQQQNPEPETTFDPAEYIELEMELMEKIL